MSDASEIVDILLGETDLGLDMEKFVRDAGVAVSADDFVFDAHQSRFGSYPTGNYTYYVYYKRLLHKGKPVYIGNISACHDYNNTGHSGHVHFYASLPSKMRQYNPLNRITGKPTLKNSKTRVSYGHGAVHMDAPEPGKSEFASLFDAAKYLLTRLRVQHPLRQA